MKNSNVTADGKWLGATEDGNLHSGGRRSSPKEIGAPLEMMRRLRNIIESVVPVPLDTQNRPEYSPITGSMFPVGEHQLTREDHAVAF